MISPARIKAAVRYMGGWSLIIFFVSLLTFIFSFLGTIFCAVLAGVMLGAARLPRWHTAAISLIFPGVAYSLVGRAKAGIQPGQLLGLTLVCFGAFWLTYFGAMVLLFYEHKGEKARRASLPGGDPMTICPRQRPLGQRGARWLSPAIGSERKAEALTIELLQGDWQYAGAGTNGNSQSKVLHVQQEQLVLSIADAQGRVKFLAQAQMSLSPSSSSQTLTSAACQGDSSPSI